MSASQRGCPTIWTKSTVVRVEGFEPPFPAELRRCPRPTRRNTQIGLIFKCFAELKSLSTLSSNGKKVPNSTESECQIEEFNLNYICMWQSCYSTLEVEALVQRDGI
jgi:hypothetical protein